MNDQANAWTGSSLAPAPGSSLGPLIALDDRSVREFTFGTGRRIYSILVIRRGSDLRAFVNECPHVGLPLTYHNSQVLSADGERLMCSNHQAEFAVDDGRALSGPVEPGCGIERIAVHVNHEGDIVIGHREEA